MVILTVIIVIISILLVAIVLLQKSKGGGLAAGFQSSNQIMGAPKTADFLEKSTWTLMGVIALLCIVGTVFFSHKSAGTGSALENSDIEAPAFPETGNADEAAPAAAEAPAEEMPGETTEG